MLVGGSGGGQGAGADGERLFGCGKFGGYEGVADEHVGVEVDLPVVGVVAIGSDGEDWTHGREGQNGYFGRGRGDHIRDPGQCWLE